VPIRPAVLDGVQLAARAVAAPLVLGFRWLGPQRIAAPCPVESSWAARCKVVADEVFFLTEFLAGSSFAFAEGARITAEVDEALALYEARGWFDDPASFHATPPAIEGFEEREAFIRGVPYRCLRFESGYRPWPGEPGRARWLGYMPNRTAHVRLFQHFGEPRPWVVCVPGYRMGSPAVDWVGFGVGWLYRRLGLNVAIPVMPFHGERSVGRRGGDGYLAGDVLDTVHAQAQAVWDIRRLVRWLRASGAPAIGLYGVSLGGYTAALLAALDEQLDCVICGIPTVCFIDLMRANTSDVWLTLTGWLGFDWKKTERVQRVISPLAMRARIASDRCFVFAGTSDTLAPPGHALDLWRHWDGSHLSWYQGGHVSFFLEPAVRATLTAALEASGVLAQPRASGAVGY
jgi:dienelactone hydrolase